MDSQLTTLSSRYDLRCVEERRGTCVYTIDALFLTAILTGCHLTYVLSIFLNIPHILQVLSRTAPLVDQEVSREGFGLCAIIGIRIVSTNNATLSICPISEVVASCGDGFNSHLACVCYALAFCTFNCYRALLYVGCLDAYGTCFNYIVS